MSDPQLHVLLRLSRITELTARAEAAEAERDQWRTRAFAPMHERDGLIIKCAALTERAEAAEAAIARVRELHAPVEGWGRDVHWCSACCDGDPTDWPCTTIRALDGGESDE